MDKCEFCKGYVTKIADEVKCINCGRLVSSASPHLALFTVTYRNQGGNKGTTYRHYDLEIASNFKALERCLDFCIGSGLTGSTLTAKYIGTKGKGGSIDKGSCRICDKNYFVTKEGKMVTHKPIDPLAKEIRSALKRARGGTGQEIASV
jgi:hypothetical protein|tara:strand:- start:380 stop:826 length:447 start_codon:yes stop_codon:yes gene_type:complete